MTNGIAGMATAGWPEKSLTYLRHRLIHNSTEYSDIGGDALVMQTLDARTLLDQFSEEVYMTDRSGRLVFANASALRRIRGNCPDAFSGELLADHYADERLELERQLISTGQSDEREERVIDFTGRTIWYATSRMPLRNDDGQVVGLMVMSRDITDRKQHEELQSAHALTLDMIARGHPLPDILANICRVVQHALIDITASILLMDEDGETLRHGAAPDLPDAYNKLVDGLRIGPRVGSCGTAAWRRTGVVVKDIQVDPLWEDFKELAGVFGLRSCWSTPLLASDGVVLGTFALYSQTVREPTEREMLFTAMAADLAGIAIERSHTERKMQHLAHHDPLTGLPNRTLFWPQFSRALHEARRESRKVTVAYLDLDNFKQINDGCGHAMGDEVLKTVAQRIAQSIRASDLVVRLGGDEFAIVFSNPVQEEVGVIRRLGEIRELISSPIEFDGLKMNPTCSMGVAFFPNDGTTPEELIAKADAAMYGAKAAGRDTLEISGRCPQTFGAEFEI